MTKVKESGYYYEVSVAHAGFGSVNMVSWVIIGVEEGVLS